MHLEKSIQDVYNFWNERPCNIRHSLKEVGTKEYFEEVTQRKYFVEPHIIEFANFSNYKNKKVLEIGCGIGTAAQSFIENGAIYTGIDLSDKSVELAKKRLELFNLQGNIFQGNIEEIDNINDDKFDLIYSFGVLHHTPDINKSIKNIYKMLKDGGEFKMMLYAKNSWKYYEIIEGLDQYEAQSGVPIANVYTNEEINTLLKDFNNIEIKQSHIFPYKIEQYKNYVYEKKDHFEAMPKKLFECLEKHLGWHLCVSCRKKNVDKKQIVSRERNDGFGGQFQNIIFTILYAEFNNLEYVHRDITEAEHNYDNDANFITKINNCMNMRGNYPDYSTSNDAICISHDELFANVENNIDVYAGNNEAINKIKKCFWKNKDRNVYKNNKFNIAIHIRRPNNCDNRLQGANAPDSYYLNIISILREKYKNKEILFHIYSQGNINSFDIYKNDDTIFHINEELCETFIGLVGANALVTSASSFSYTAALITDAEVYFLPFWHKPKNNWLIL